MTTGYEPLLDQLEARRDHARAEAEALLRRVQSDGRDKLSKAEACEFKGLLETANGLDQRCTDIRSEIARTGSARRLVGSSQGAEAYASRWARETAQTLRRNLGGEGRAVISGSVDIPILVEPLVVGTPFKGRLIDAFAVRETTESNAFEYFQQTARTNNAAPVADLATKPTSVLTVAAKQDRCRVVATLSEPLPLRIWYDEPAITNWLSTQLAGCVLDAIESQAISGSGSGENMRGILNTSGVTAVGFATDVPTTLRKAVTALQNLGEVPTGWALNPADAEAIDLLRWGASGGFLSGGYQHDTRDGVSGSSDNVFGTYPRIISPNVPAGTALLADWSQLKLYFREMMRLDVDGGGELFDTNAVKFRAESRVGIGVLRPQAFAVVDLTA